MVLDHPSRLYSKTSIRFFGEFSQPDANGLQNAFIQCLALRTKLPRWVQRMDGMSGRKYRYLVNNLVALTPNARYMEIGSWAGSTACAAMHGNTVEMQCIDDWSEFGGPKNEFFANTGRCITDDIGFRFIESYFRVVDFSSIGLFTIYLFDGPHSENDQYDGITIVQRALDDTYVLCVDDWNWLQVREGTFRALNELKTQILARIEIRTTQDNSHSGMPAKFSDWHNGYLFAVCRKSDT